MVERLRFLLERPLDPLAARAVAVLATAILLGFVAVCVLGSGESRLPARPREQTAPQPAPPSPRPIEHTKAPRPPHPRRQDPQDEKGSAAAVRAARTLRSHRALQHVPFRRARLSVRLVGARGGRAVLAVSAPTISAARQGWRRFLRRYGDDGRAYLTRFEATGGHGG
ncbi:MAG TPA: hypothetical protein VFI63_01635 [Solirubrobacterales bacterium]|nr:hypothetical protein [Solirubrobacterales bacterium]